MYISSRIIIRLIYAQCIQTHNPAWAYRAEGAAAPQFVGQTKPFGQYSLHSRAILAYNKNKWDKFCQFCGKFCQFCGKYAI
jgi:hypothetical protein